jgi:hypothetical protein
MAASSPVAKSQGRWWRLARVIAATLVVAALTLGVLEVGLRLAPGLIPEDALKWFDRGVRVEIARRRFLPNESQTYVARRDDGGPPIKLFEAQAKIAYTFVDTGDAGTIPLDDQGFCNAPEDRYDRARIDVIAIGDSFTFCLPMAPALTWPSVLGRALGRSAYNLGRGGYGPYEYLQLLKLFGLAKAPAVVVMQIYEGNDLRDAARFHEYTRAAEAGKAGFLDRAGREPLGVDPVPLLANPLGRHSYAYNLGVVGLASAGGWGRRQLAALGGDSRAQVNFRYRLAFPEGAVAFNIRDHDRDEVRSARDLREARLRLQVLDEALAAFVALARTHGFTPVVAYAPSAYSAYAEFVEFEDPALRELMPWFHRTQVDYLATKARELGFVFADETPALQAQARRHRARSLLYYPINVHFTPAGHETAAATIAAALQR